MGLPMAQAIRAAGIDLRGLDLRAPESYGPNASWMTDDPRAFAADRQAIFSVVRDIAQTEMLLFGEHGLLAAACKLEILAICSTLAPSYVRDLRARIPGHIALVDAPMSGAPVAAHERRLSFMLGGPEAALDRLAPALNAMGTRFHRLGPLGTGMTAKVLNNLVAAASVAATRTALEWADANGLPEEALLAVMNDSSGQTWFGSNFAQINFAREGFAPDNSMAILVKDVESARSAAPEGTDTSLADALIARIAALPPRPPKS